MVETLEWRSVISRRAVIKAAVVGLMAGPTHSLSLLADDKTDVAQRLVLNAERGEDVLLMALTRAGQRLFAVGEHGVILFSDDDGTSWRRADVPVSISLTNIYFATLQKAWAVGHAGVVLRTTDSGVTWRKQLTAAALKQDAPDHVFFDVHFSDERRGFVVGAYGSLLATTDGGDNWLPWQGRINDRKDQHLYCIRAIGSMLYIAGEQGAFFRSSDGGETFTRIKTPYSGSYFGILTDANNNLIIFGFGGHAYRSRDAGNHWQRIETGSTAALTAGAVLTDGSIVLGSQAGAVLRSTDGGRSFQPVSGPTSIPVTGIIQANDGHLILSSAQGIVRIGAMPKQRKES